MGKGSFVFGSRVWWVSLSFVGLGGVELFSKDIGGVWVGCVVCRVLDVEVCDVSLDNVCEN